MINTERVAGGGYNGTIPIGQIGRGPDNGYWLPSWARSLIAKQLSEWSGHKVTISPLQSLLLDTESAMLVRFIRARLIATYTTRQRRP